MFQPDLETMPRDRVASSVAGALGVSATVNLVESRTIQRSESTAERVIDLREGGE